MCICLGEFVIHGLKVDCMYMLISFSFNIPVDSTYFFALGYFSSYFYVHADNNIGKGC